MIKGTIECSFGEVKTNAVLGPCELLFAVGIWTMSKKSWRKKEKV